MFTLPSSSHSLSAAASASDMALEMAGAPAASVGGGNGGGGGLARDAAGTCERVGAQIVSLPRPSGGWPVASKGLGPLATMRENALARGCGRCGRVVLPLARAAAVSTG